MRKYDALYDLAVAQQYYNDLFEHFSRLTKTVFTAIHFWSRSHGRKTYEVYFLWIAPVKVVEKWVNQKGSKTLILKTEIV